jgi:hypothetical protein
MSNNKFSADIINDALFRVGEPTDGTSQFHDAAIRYLNKAYQAIWTGGRELDANYDERWWWLRKSGILTLEKFIKAGTVSVTQDSTSITFSVAPTNSVVGYHFKVLGSNTLYKIISHTGGATSATLDSPLVTETDTEAEYRVFKLEYDLASDLLYLIAPMRKYSQSSFDASYKIYGGDSDDVETTFPLALVNEGVPDRFAIINEQTVRFNRMGNETETIRVEYDYIYQPADLTDSASEEPAMPYQYRSILADYMAYLLAIDKNDNRFSEYLGSARTAMAGMVNENRRRMSTIGNNFLILPRRGQHLSSRLIRTESGLIIGGV